MTVDDGKRLLHSDSRLLHCSVEISPPLVIHPYMNDQAGDFGIGGEGLATGRLGRLSALVCLFFVG